MIDIRPELLDQASDSLSDLLMKERNKSRSNKILKELFQ